MTIDVDGPGFVSVPSDLKLVRVSKSGVRTTFPDRGYWSTSYHVPGSPRTSTPLSRGWRHPNPYSRKMVVSHCTSPGWGRWESTTGVLSGNFVGYANQAFLAACCPLGGSIMSDLVANATIDARASVNAGDIDLGVSIGESRETFEHLALQGARLMKLYGLLRKGRFGQLRKELHPKAYFRHTGSIANYWLEYNYAWRPLLDDVYGAASELQRGFDQKDQIFRSVGIRDTEQPVSIGSYFVPHAFGARVVVYYKVSDPNLARLARLGLTNPASIAWELLPYSFVLDWFTPVGAFIDGVTALHGISVVSVTTTRRSTVDWENPYTGDPILSPGANRERTNPTYRVQGLAMQRSVGTSIAWTLPRFEHTPITSKRAANAAALLRQRIRTNT